MPTICLFAAQPPHGGGGSVTLRSLTKNLPEFNFIWKYVSMHPSPGFESGYCGPGIMGSGLIQDLLSTWKIISGRKSLFIDKIVKNLAETDCDAYWIVSHNEGLRVANELTRLQTGRPIHVSFHDDWAGALCARSTRYKLFFGKALNLTIDTIQRVDSYDVTSLGMKQYYESITNKTAGITHRYIDCDLDVQGTEFKNLGLEVNVGHVGAIYSKKEFLIFLKVLKEYGHSTGKKICVHLWGADFQNASNEFQDIVKIHPTLPEDQIIPTLTKCDFVYAMYPMNESLRLFSMTSMQTKLATYIRAGRPILGHCPSESSLAEFLTTTNTGIVWADNSSTSGVDAVSRILYASPTKNEWFNACNKYFGAENLRVIRQAFTK